MASGVDRARAGRRNYAAEERHARADEKRAIELALFGQRKRTGPPKHIEFEFTGDDGLRLGIVGWDEKRLYAARYSRATRAWTTSMEPYQTLRLMEAWINNEQEGRNAREHRDVAARGSEESSAVGGPSSAEVDGLVSERR